MTYQGRLNVLTRARNFRDKSLIIVFEGQDAARITGALDARHYQVIPIAAPTQEERAQPYLWRFWRHREKWPEYERAVCDMIERCSTGAASWNVIPANDKLFA